MIICRRNHCINGIKIHYRCQAFETKSRQTLDEKWKRDFLLEKCNVLAVTRNTNMIKFNYTFHGHPLESLEHVKCQISLSNIYNV